MKAGLLITCMISLSYLSLSPILASIAKSFPDVNQSLVQMVLTLPNLMFIICAPLSGILSRLIRKKTVVEIAALCYLIGGLFPFFFHSSIWMLLFGSMIIGLGTGLLMPVSNELICDYFDLNERGQMMGLNATFVAIGGIMFIFLSGMLSGIAWHYSYLCFLLVIPVLIVIIFCVPDGIKHVSEGGKSKSGFEMNPYVFALFIIGFLYFILQNAFNTNSSSYVSEIMQGDGKIASVITIANSIGGMIGGTLFGIIVKKINNQIETLAVSFAAVGFFLAYLLPSFAPLLLGSALVGAGFAIFNAAGTFLLSQKLKPENNAFTVAIYMALINLGAAMSPFIVNSVSGIFAPTLAIRFLVCGIALAIVAAASFLVNSKS